MHRIARSVSHVTGRELLDELEAQESRLVFDHFDEDTAWALGVALRKAASRMRFRCAICDPSQRPTTLPRALPGSSADNDGWLERKAAVVDRYGRSSLRVGEQFRAAGGAFDKDSRLDTAVFAGPRRGSPSRSWSTGAPWVCRRRSRVSGLPELADHRLVVEALEAFLSRRS